MIKNKRLRFTNVQWRIAIKLVHIATEQFTIMSIFSIVSEMCLRDQTVAPGDNPLLFSTDTTGSFMSTL